MYGTARKRSDRNKNLVGFIVGDVRYALQILRVREIINPLPVVSLPHAPVGIVGVTDHRGLIVPILDLRSRFGLSIAKVSRRTKWVIVQLEGRAVGLIVDGVTDVFGTAAEEQRDVPQLGLGEKMRGITEVYKHDGELVFVLDVDKVAAPVTELDMEALEQLVSGGSEAP